MDEEQFYRVVWGVKNSPALSWGVKVFADVAESARNLSEARQFYSSLVQEGIPCQLQTALGVTVRDSELEKYNAKAVLPTNLGESS